MCMTIAALSSQTVFLPREIMYFGRSISRFYHGRRKLFCINNFLSEPRSLFSFVMDTSTVPRACYSNENKIGFTDTLTKEKAKDVVSKLTTEERDLFLKALEQCKSEEDKAGYQRNYLPNKIFSKIKLFLANFRIIYFFFCIFTFPTENNFLMLSKDNWLLFDGAISLAGPAKYQHWGM